MCLPLLFAFGLAILLPGAPHAVERRGDFFFDESGRLLASRSVDVPKSFPRAGLSFRDKAEALGLELPARPTTLIPRRTRPKPGRIEQAAGHFQNRIEVKFVDHVPVRLRSGLWIANSGEVADAQGIVDRYPEAHIERMFREDERVLAENRDVGERLGNRALADLDNWYLVTFPGDTERVLALANELLPLAIVENVSLVPIPRVPETCANLVDIGNPVQDWTFAQFHLNPAPQGIDALFAWSYHAGGDGFGESYDIVDCEIGWCLSHEDVPLEESDIVNGGGAPDTMSAINHGTAVLGIIGACENGYGMTGISHDVDLKMANFLEDNTLAATINAAANFLFLGELMVLEVHFQGPDTLGTCPCNCGQYGWVCVEWNAASFDVIETATANGILTAEAAGNGGSNLDSSVYGDWFDVDDPDFVDSGAVLIGAGDVDIIANPSHIPSCFTNYGSRVDVHGYGESVRTTGYGDFGGNGFNCSEDYTNTFSGTSSATPIVAGAMASLQGIAKAKYGVTLSPGLIRDAIKVGGTPQGAPQSKNIGPMPDLVNAINEIEPDVRPYAPAGWTYEVVPRSTNNSGVNNAPLSALALPGNVPNTFWNWGTINESIYTPTLSGPNTLLYRDDTSLWEALVPNLDPGQWGVAINVGPDIVKGGRHTIRSLADWSDTEEEQDEVNNDWARQFIWSPQLMVANVSLTRTDDPPALSSGWGPWFNAEGFSAAPTTRFMHAFAILPADASDDFDIRLNLEAPANIPQAGFGAHVAWSSEPAGLIDFVVVDRYEAAPGTYYASALNVTGAGADDKIVEWEEDAGLLTVTGVSGPFTIASGNLIEMHELPMGAGQSYRIDLEFVGGSADLGMSVYDTEGAYFSKTQTLPGGFANDHGPGADEGFIVTPDAGGSFALAVWKSGTADRLESATYNIRVSQQPNLWGATPLSWYGPVVPRNAQDVTIDVVPLPDSLFGNQPTTSFNFTTTNEGVNVATAPWFTRLSVDDVPTWNGDGTNLASGDADYWINSAVGGPQSNVRGGRHMLRLDADVDNDVGEFDEVDNLYTEFFVWTPLVLADQTPVQRPAPPTALPEGAIWFSVDGFRCVGDVGHNWTAVGILPVFAAGDCDIRMYDASTGAKDGFGPNYAYSGAPPGLSDFSLVAYATASQVERDYGVIGFLGTNDFWIQRADATYLGILPQPAAEYGPFTIDEYDVLDLVDFDLPPELLAVPLKFELVNESGSADLGIALYDGQVAYHGKLDALVDANANGPGGDEEFVTSIRTLRNYALAIYKNGSADLGKANTYRLLIGEDGATEAAVEGILPTRLALSAPRPNPAPGGFSFAIELPGHSMIRLAIYDAAGRRVCTLADGLYSAGRHRLTWNGSDESGRHAASGVYFARLDEAGGARAQQRLVLIR